MTQNISTKCEAKGFVDTVLMGLADDGGLMVPQDSGDFSNYTGRVEKP
jgi:hypothetical protein